MAIYREDADAASDTSTTYAIAAGDTFSGSLDHDTDWIKVKLIAGKAYQIDLKGSASWAVPAVFDSYGSMRDRGEYGKTDDGASDFRFIAPKTGAYYIQAGSLDNVGQGDYKVRVKTVKAPHFASYDTIATYMTDKFWDQPYKFDIRAGATLKVNLGGLTSEGRQLAKWALETWTEASGIKFKIVSGSAEIKFDDKEIGAEGGASSIKNGIASGTYVNVPVSWIKDYGAGYNTYTLGTYIHEIGHALGLGHPGRYDNSASGGQLFANDSKQLTAMSYLNTDDNIWVTALKAPPITPMMVDVLAIRKLYGSTSIHAGDTSHTLKAEYSGGSGMMTLVDTGGRDTLKLDWVTANQRIDLHAESFSSVAGGLNNFSLARGTVIENAIGGRGNDVIIGNSSANVIKGGAGNDALAGGTGKDKLTGGSGSDTFVFAKGDAKDIVTDFAASEDLLELAVGSVANTYSKAMAHAHQSGDNVVFDFGHGDEVVLQNIKLESLTVTNIHFSGSGLT
jgi:serralysin